jgi:hypothetical protein
MLDSAGNRARRRRCRLGEPEEFDYWGGTCSGFDYWGGTCSVHASGLPMPLQPVFELLGMLNPAGNRGGKEAVPPERVGRV